MELFPWKIKSSINPTTQEAFDNAWKTWKAIAKKRNIASEKKAYTEWIRNSPFKVNFKKFLKEVLKTYSVLCLSWKDAQGVATEALTRQLFLRCLLALVLEMTYRLRIWRVTEKEKPFASCLASAASSVVQLCTLSRTLEAASGCSRRDSKWKAAQLRARNFHKRSHGPFICALQLNWTGTLNQKPLMY